MDSAQRQHQDYGRSLRRSQEYNQRHGENDGWPALATQGRATDFPLRSPAV